MIVEQPKAQQHEQRQGGGDERAAQEPFLFSVHILLLHSAATTTTGWACAKVYDVAFSLGWCHKSNQIKSNQFDLFCSCWMSFLRMMF